MGTKQVGDSTWYQRGVVFKPKDTILINFGTDKRSEFEVVEVNKRKNLLKVKVIVDHYDGKDKFETGAIVDIGKSIFEGYWFFTLLKAVVPAADKFRMGQTLNAQELMEIPLVDRCRYVVSKYFKKGFSAGEVHGKLCQLNELNGLFTPMEVHDALCQFYGRPDEKAV